MNKAKKNNNGNSNDESSTSTSTSSELNSDDDLDGRRRNKFIKKKENFLKLNNKVEETMYDINTPLVEGLVKIRNKCETNNSSNHIAALIPNKHNFTQNYNSSNVTKGINSDKTKYGNKNVRTHAEMDAIRKTSNQMKCNKIKKGKKMSLLILRVNKNGKLCCSAPCLHCTMQLSKVTNIIIDKIYFSIDNEKIVSVKFNDWVINPSQHITSGWKTLNRKNNEKNKKKSI
jgi:hypothetical protein